MTWPSCIGIDRRLCTANAYLVSHVALLDYRHRVAEAIVLRFTYNRFAHRGNLVHPNRIHIVCCLGRAPGASQSAFIEMDTHNGADKSVSRPADRVV